MRQVIIIAIGGAALALAGCATPSARIATSLERYGLDAPRAQCVGDRLQRELSLSQLSRLGKAAQAYREGDTDPGRLTVADLLRVAGEIRDPRIALEVGKAAAGCGVAP